MTEKQIENIIKAHVRTAGGWVVKIHADAVQGRETLDLHGSYLGRPFLVEVKDATGKTSALQNYLVRRAKRSGYVSGVVSSLAQFLALFDV